MSAKAINYKNAREECQKDGAELYQPDVNDRESFDHDNNIIAGLIPSDKRVGAGMFSL